jgi:serine protease Do
MKKFLQGFLVFFLGLSLTNAQVPQKTPPPMKLTDPLPANLFVELSRIINPAVVNISTSMRARKAQPGMRDPMLELLERFYGVQPEQQPYSNKPQQIGLGTGFIIREDGLILTNNHVIEGADIVQVQLSDSEKLYDAKVIGSDGRTDVALIKIKPSGKLPVAALGDSKDLKVGEWVAAFGNPFGHSHTMTKGIVSSVKREIAEINRVPLIQTDASINPGNSGGPLVDTRGYVVGVNSAIDPRGQGIGFAIPIDDIKKILPDLESRGSIRKGYLGLGLGDHTDESAQDLGLDETHHGAVVVKIDPKGPGAKAGIKMYDTITDFNGHKIKNSIDLMDDVSSQAPGSTVPVTILSPNRKSRVVKVAIAERNEKTAAMGSRADQPAEIKGQKAPYNLGFSVTDLNAQLRQQLELEGDIKKPMIISIDEASIASMAGLQVGDVILEVNKKEVTTATDVTKALKKNMNSIRIVRGNQMIVVTFGE